jgi:hypothetical protein
MRSKILAALGGLGLLLLGWLGSGIRAWLASEPLSVRLDQVQQLGVQAGQLGAAGWSVAPWWAWVSVGALVWYALAAVVVRRLPFKKKGDQSWERGVTWMFSPLAIAGLPAWGLAYGACVLLELAGRHLLTPAARPEPKPPAPAQIDPGDCQPERPQYFEVTLPSGEKVRAFTCVKDFPAFGATGCHCPECEAEKGKQAKGAEMPLRPDWREGLPGGETKGG